MHRISPKSRKFRRGTALADARATGLMSLLRAFSSPTVKEGGDFGGAVTGAIFKWASERNPVLH